MEEENESPLGRVRMRRDTGGEREGEEDGEKDARCLRREKEMMEKIGGGNCK